jgi:hypothetical protein
LDDARDGLTVALRSLLRVPCARSLATNSIILRFDTRADPGGRAYLWIDPPWRLTASGLLVTGSMDWPTWDGVEDEEVNRPLWEAWCAHFDPLSGAELEEVSVGLDCPDLSLHFTTGHRLETFGNISSDYWWYYRDRATGDVFEAGASGIRYELGKPSAV